MGVFTPQKLANTAAPPTLPPKSQRTAGRRDKLRAFRSLGRRQGREQLTWAQVHVDAATCVGTCDVSISSSRPEF